LFPALDVYGGTVTIQKAYFTVDDQGYVYFGVYGEGSSPATSSKWWLREPALQFRSTIGRMSACGGAQEITFSLPTLFGTGAIGAKVDWVLKIERSGCP